ncbi:DUF4860 domain-containing protein [Clostridium sp. E02]|uniref:DUF4860 domain-containing protein n=1 Tax=Clostridium sp. E02 TaxID=2487134 RepID=UPI000F53DF84|nr:DUF4860 domain-containing protein [Clostridium sp. E02]
MKSREDQTNQATHILFPLLLLLVFVLSALFLVLIGAKVYENINARTERSYQKDVALSYLANKIRQGDEAGSVRLKESDGVLVVEMEQKINDSIYVTWIYYQDGSLYELFSEKGSGISLFEGTEILKCNQITMESKKGLLHIRSAGDTGGELWLSLRSGGGFHE